MNNEIIRAVEKGQIIEAIKLLRSHENLDLKTAKSKIDGISLRMKRGEKVTLENIDSVGSIEFIEGPDIPDAAVLLLQKGEYIPAIKTIRQMKGLGLKEAKVLADNYYVMRPEFKPAQSKFSMSLRIILLVIAVIVIANVFMK